MTAVSYRQFTGTTAENYQRFFVPAIAIPVSKDLLAGAELRTGDRVLDVACGTGVITRLAAECVGASGTVTGLDVTPDMIEVAKSVPAPKGAAIDWLVADASSLPLPDASVDVVLCQMGLMFMEDPGAVIGEMRRVLAPSGRLAINTPGRIQPLFETMESAIVDNISADLGGFVSTVFSINDPDSVAALLLGAGLQQVSAWVATTTLRFPKPAEFLWHYIGVTPMAPLIDQAPEPAKVAMEQQFVDGAQAYVVEGVTVVQQPMVVATARR
ncbi:MAG TPA: methyltransferase domain-containing protein [Mycobacterium sp.]|nr:methyltransferase domain-containing protein [Mycobacterium sp.]